MNNTQNIPNFVPAVYGNPADTGISVRHEIPGVTPCDRCRGYSVYFMELKRDEDPVHTRVCMDCITYIFNDSPKLLNYILENAKSKLCVDYGTPEKE